MNFQGEYVYVIQEREFVNSGEPVYKIGRSQCILKRMAQYPNESQVHMVVKVADAMLAEKYLIGQLKNYHDIVHRKNIGTEYFQGDLRTIMNTVLHVANMIHGKYKDPEVKPKVEVKVEPEVEVELDVEPAEV